MEICRERHDTHSSETHLGHWNFEHAGQDQLMATVSLDQNGNQWDLQREKGVHGTVSQDTDRACVADGRRPASKTDLPHPPRPHLRLALLASGPSPTLGEEQRPV